MIRGAMTLINGVHGVRIFLPKRRLIIPEIDDRPRRHDDVVSGSVYQPDVVQGAYTGTL
jgi:hypothetical protein